MTRGALLVVIVLNDTKKFRVIFPDWLKSYDPQFYTYGLPAAKAEHVPILDLTTWAYVIEALASQNLLANR